MLQRLHPLSEDEKQELFDAVPVITLLIAGADGKIDDSELDWSKKLTNIRSYNEDGELQLFYAEIEKDYKDRLDRWMKVIPAEMKERNELLSQRLSQLNPILAKLDNETGALIYDSFTSFAKHIAKAEGGILGFASISKDEAKLIDLPMLTPIIKIDDEAADA